jgi:uncharacterized sulfatase
MYPLDRIKAPVSAADPSVPAAAWFTTPPNWGVSEQGQRETIRAYYASISFLDANVGRLLDALERLRLLDNTIVVFMSDHGYHLGDKGQWMKQTLFERSARAPVIIAGYGVPARHRATSRIVEFLDLYPTLAELTRLSPPSNLHGRSLVPLLKNPDAAWNHPALTQVRRGNAATGFMGYSIRTEQWRYTEWDEGKRGTELYDERADPSETTNLATNPKYESVVARLRQELRRLTASSASTGRASR